MTRKNTNHFHLTAHQATESGDPFAFLFNHISTNSNYPAFPIMHMTHSLQQSPCLLTSISHKPFAVLLYSKDVSALTAFRGFGGTARLQFFNLHFQPFLFPHPSHR